MEVEWGKGGGRREEVWKRGKNGGMSERSGRRKFRKKVSM
jgi:hypothetical protein